MQTPGEGSPSGKPVQGSGRDSKRNRGNFPRKSMQKPSRGPGKNHRSQRSRALVSSHVHNLLSSHHRQSVFERKLPIRSPSDVGSLQSLDPRSYEPLSDDAVSISGSFVDPLQVYRFRLGGYTTLGRTAGVSNAFIAADPSASGWNSPEWATLSALFSEFRLVELSIRISRVNPASITQTMPCLAICSNLGTAVNPGSYAAVADNADAVLFAWQDTSKAVDHRSGMIHTMKATGLNWSQVTTPTVEPYAGAPGSIQFYADNSAASGTDTIIYQILISGIYDFRIRV